MPVEGGPLQVLCRPTRSSAQALACRGKFALWKRLSLLAGGLIALAFGSTRLALAAADGTGTLELRPELSDSSLPADCPSFPSQSVNIEVRRMTGGKSDGQRALFGEVRAVTRPECGTPVVGGLKVAATPGTGEFKFKIPLRGARTRASFLLVDLRGIPRKVTLDVVFPDYASLLKGAPKQGTFSVGLGYTIYSYSEEGVREYSATAITPKVSVDFPIIPGRLSVGGNLFGNVLILSSNVGDAFSIQFFGGNLRATYILPRVLPPRWKLSVSTGIYMVTSMDSVNPNCVQRSGPCLAEGTSAFGFANLTGPQLYPAVSYALPNDHVVATYFKYSPVSSGFSFLGASREIAYGLSYTLPKRTRDGVRPGWSVSVDRSDLLLSIEDMIGKLSSTTFSINYAF